MAISNVAVPVCCTLRMLVTVSFVQKSTFYVSLPPLRWTTSELLSLSGGYQNCSMLGCVTQCSQSAAHACEQFLQVQQIGFVTLGHLHHA